MTEISKLQFCIFVQIFVAACMLKFLKKNNFKLCHIDKLFWCSPNKLMCLVFTKVNKWIWIAHYNLVQLSRARNNWQHLLTDILLMIKSSPISPNCPGVFE